MTTVKLQSFYRLIEERAAEFAIFAAGVAPEAESRPVPSTTPDANRNYRNTARPMQLGPTKNAKKEQ